MLAPFASAPLALHCPPAHWHARGIYPAAFRVTCRALAMGALLLQGNGSHTYKRKTTQRQDKAVEVFVDAHTYLFLQTCLANLRSSVTVFKALRQVGQQLRTTSCTYLLQYCSASCRHHVYPIQLLPLAPPLHAHCHTYEQCRMGSVASALKPYYQN